MLNNMDPTINDVASTLFIKDPMFNDNAPMPDSIALMMSNICPTLNSITLLMNNIAPMFHINGSMIISNSPTLGSIEPMHLSKASLLSSPRHFIPRKRLPPRSAS